MFYSTFIYAAIRVDFELVKDSSTIATNKMLRTRASLLTLLGCSAVSICAAPAINVALEASFSSAPFLVELL